MKCYRFLEVPELNSVIATMAVRREGKHQLHQRWSHTHCLTSHTSQQPEIASLPRSGINYKGEGAEVETEECRM